MQAAAKAARMGLHGNPHSDLHTANTSPFPTHSQCSFVGLAEATPEPLPGRAESAGRQKQSCFPPGHSRVHIVFSHGQQSLQQARVEALCPVVSRCCIIPIRLRCQQATGDWHFSYWFFSSSSLCFIHGNHSKCTVPSPDPAEVSDGAPADPSGAGV